LRRTSALPQLARGTLVVLLSCLLLSVIFSPLRFGLMDIDGLECTGSRVYKFPACVLQYEGPGDSAENPMVLDFMEDAPEAVASSSRSAVDSPPLAVEPQIDQLGAARYPTPAPSVSMFDL
jgi:hypothetical protein